MEAVVKQLLSTEILTPFGRNGGGCINEGRSYAIDDGTQIYVKYKADKNGARQMFEGEFASLEAIKKTGRIRVPMPRAVGDYPSGSLLIMEHLEMHSSLSQTAGQLGTQLAHLHLDNQELVRLSPSTESFVGQTAEDRGVDKFGFEVTTCCGFLPLDNDWCEDWIRFFCGQRLQTQMDMDRVKGDRQAQELWGQLLRRIPTYFEGIEVVPALLHGDLWSGNVSQTPANDVGEETTGRQHPVPVVFDPAAFYGHDEFELGIITMFGGFRPEFFDGENSRETHVGGRERSGTRNAGPTLSFVCFIFSSRFSPPHSLSFVDSEKTRLSESD